MVKITSKRIAKLLNRSNKYIYILFQRKQLSLKYREEEFEHFIEFLYNQIQKRKQRDIKNNLLKGEENEK